MSDEPQTTHYFGDSCSPPHPIPKPSPQPKAKKRLKRGARPRKQRKSTPAKIAREADRLWSLLVRARGHSEISGKTEHLQAAHGISRRYRNTRWLLLNGFALTRAEHVYYTHRPLEWDEYLRKAWGELAYNEMRLIALRTTSPDVAAELARLQAEAKERGIL